jgi:hypothetical protein
MPALVGSKFLVNTPGLNSMRLRMMSVELSPVVVAE